MPFSNISVAAYVTNSYNQKQVWETGSTILKQSQTVSNVYSKIWTCKQSRS